MMNEFTSKLEVKLVEHLASDRAVVDAARVSVEGERALTVPPKRVEGLIEFLMKNGHTSPFEHGVFKFFVRVPIFVAREFMRHRTFSFNEESGRYRQLRPVFYVPDSERPLVQIGKAGQYSFSAGTECQSRLTKFLLSAIAGGSYRAYKLLLGLGVAKEVARMLLPVNIYTSFYATVDPHNLMKFLDLRTDEQAMYEIRQVANQMEEYFKQAMPITWQAWKDKKKAS